MRDTVRLAGLSTGLVMTLLGSSAIALDPSHQLTQFGHTAWRVRDGLLPGTPTAITQAADGFLWIGTDTGLVRFDGVQVVSWSPPEGMRLPDDRIVALLGAKDGSVWIGTGNGLAQWKDGRLIVHARLGRFGALLEDRDGVVWAGHTRAVTELPPLCRSAADDFRCFGSSDSLPLHFGTIIARLAWSLDASEENNKTFGRAQSFVAGHPKNGVQFMVKNSKTCASTGGWGYAQFDDGKPADDKVMGICYPCHKLIADRDFVFTRYAP